MASLKDVIGGLQIVAKYCFCGMDEHSTEADHGILFAGIKCDKEQMAKEDIEEMHKLRWKWDEEHGCWSRFT